MAALPGDLSAALDSALSGFSQHQLGAAVDRLSTRYRSGEAADAPILASKVDVAAYAAYRMPATYAAVRAVLGEIAARLPDFAPRSQMDVGGGTGAAVWAGADTWPTLTDLTVLEQATPAIEFGRVAAEAARSPAVQATRWQRGVIDTAAPAPTADVVTLSYVLGELPESERAAVVAWLAASAPMVVLIEPGTPAGYARVLAARDQLIAAGRTVVAPCPHDGPCPIPLGQDWCHFSTRLTRSSVHRAIKDATLGFEDEKYAYVAATTLPATAAEGRVLRHPRTRKRLVLLTLCTKADGLVEELVSKRHADRYRDARAVEWGDAWPHPTA